MHFYSIFSSQQTCFIESKFPRHNPIPQMVQTNYAFDFAQSPFVDCERGSIYFADSDVSCNSPSIFRYDVLSGLVYGATVTNADESISIASSAIPVKGCKDQFICNIDAGISRVTWDGVSTTAYRTADIASIGSPSEYLTDWAKTSPTGKYYFSALNPDFCSGNTTGIHEYDPKTGAVTNRIPNVYWTNGFCWNPCTNTFYLNNDCTYYTDAYYFDSGSGSLSKQTEI